MGGGPGGDAVSFRILVRRRRAWIAVAAAAAVLAAAALLAARRATEQRAAARAIPVLDGTRTVAGLEHPLEIVRDVRGIPHVRAGSERDAYFGLGFVHAQDRLAQMTWLVRSARGRTAEAIGRAGLEADRWSRTLGFARLAEEQLARLDPATRARLDAYAAGVNAWIEPLLAKEAPPPVALARLGIAPEPWSAADTLAVAKALAWGLDGSVEATLTLRDLVDRLGAFAARPFFPPDAARQLVPIPLPRSPAARGRGDPGALARALGLAGRSVGSSAWVVAGEAAANGKPLLAGDLHLAPTWPALLYEAHLAAPGFEVIGAGPPGVPVFWSGHNGRVAWAATHARAAVVDLHEETIDPQDPDRYRRGTRWSPIERREERIAVRGEEPELWTVRSTHHGPPGRGRGRATASPRCSGRHGRATRPASGPRSRAITSRCGCSCTRTRPAPAGASSPAGCRAVRSRPRSCRSQAARAGTTGAAGCPSRSSRTLRSARGPG
jgi:penicillin amidase